MAEKQMYHHLRRIAGTTLRCRSCLAKIRQLFFTYQFFGVLRASLQIVSAKSTSSILGRWNSMGGFPMCLHATFLHVRLRGPLQGQHGVLADMDRGDCSTQELRRRKELLGLSLHLDNSTLLGQKADHPTHERMHRDEGRIPGLDLRIRP